MSSTSTRLATSKRTPTSIYRPALIRHDGACGRRLSCFRPECRERFGSYLTLEILPDRAIAYCHRLIVALDDPRLRAIAA